MNTTFEELPEKVKEEITNNIKRNIDEYDCEGMDDYTWGDTPDRVSDYLFRCIDNYVKRVMAILGITINRFGHVDTAYHFVPFDGTYRYNTDFSLSKLLEETNDKKILEAASVLMRLHSKNPYVVHIRIQEEFDWETFRIIVDTSESKERFDSDEYGLILMNAQYSVAQCISPWLYQVWEAVRMEFLRLKNLNQERKER